MKFAVVVAAYNSMKWLPDTLKSISSQEYDNYVVCVVDDNSDDPGQADYVRSTCELNGWNYILNDENKGAMFNQVAAINSLDLDDDDVVVIVDGDDRLAHSGVLGRLNEIYSSSDVQVTYGNYLPVPASDTCPKPGWYTDYVKQTNSYRRATRTNGIMFNHLRTFKYRLFRHMNPERDFMLNGKWFEACADTAIMIPALELAGGRYKFVDEILYHYNSENPISDWRQRARVIDRIHGHILKRLTPYSPLEF